jgi:aminoglycoside 6'-N-acetyltransferase
MTTTFSRREIASLSEPEHGAGKAELRPAETGGYAFRRVVQADLPMVQRWLATPEVRRWWGDPDEQIAILEEDLSDPRMSMWIVSRHGRPFACVQDYDPLSWGIRAFDVPAGARGLDPFIGEPEMLNRGHGSAFLRTHVDRLFAGGVPAACIDPDPKNARAIRAYEKAGFGRVGETLDSEGKTVLLMLRFAPQGQK